MLSEMYVKNINENFCGKDTVFSIYTHENYKLILFCI